MSDKRNPLIWRNIAESIIEHLDEHEELQEGITGQRLLIEELEAERDEAQADRDAMSRAYDRMQAKRDRALAEYARLCAERDQATAEMKREEARANLLREAYDATVAERDRLRAGQDRWERDDFPCCSYGTAPTGYADDDHQDA